MKETIKLISQDKDGGNGWKYLGFMVPGIIVFGEGK